MIAFFMHGYVGGAERGTVVRLQPVERRTAARMASRSVSLGRRDATAAAGDRNEHPKHPAEVLLWSCERIRGDGAGGEGRAARGVLLPAQCSWPGAECTPSHIHTQAVPFMASLELSACVGCKQLKIRDIDITED
jgi:hypothetical protein